MTIPKPSKGAFLSYGLFDFGISAFTLIIHAFTFPLFFRTILLADNPRGDFYWGLMLSGTAIAGTLLAPFVGREGDRRGRFRVFRVVALSSFAATAVLATSIWNGDFTLIVVSFALASTLYFVASNFYDGLLAVIADPASRAKVSGFAWGFGYLGGIGCLVLLFLWNEANVSSVSTYAITALFYAAAGGLGMFLLRSYVSDLGNSSRISLKEMLAALTRPRLQLLIGYWLIADTINAIIGFVGIYGVSDLQMSTTQVGYYLMAIQAVAFPATWIAALIATRTNLRGVIEVCIGIWVVVIALLALRIPASQFWLLVLLTASVIGSTQALMRAEYADLVSEGRSAEMFGWFAFATKAMAVVMPIVFGAISSGTGSRALAMASLAIPLVVGGLLSHVGSRGLRRSIA